MQLELFTTFNNHFVYNDDIDALGWGNYVRKKEEHDEEEYYLQRADRYNEYTPICFDCGLSQSDTINYKEYENEH